MANRPLEAEMYEAHQKDRNRRIEEGDAVEQTQKMRGWGLISMRLDREREIAMRHCLIISKESDGGRMWRERLSTLDWIFGMIEGFVRERDAARREIEAEREMERDFPVPRDQETEIEPKSLY